jgi:putative MFS transporter
MNLKFTFEQLTEERIGFGKYQCTILSLLGLIFISDGIEMASLTTISPILKNEWKFTANLQGLLGTFLFVGFFIGSTLSAFFTDRLGRKETLQYVSLVQFILSVYSTTATNVYIFLVIRCIFGLLIGIIVPLIPALCAEIIPSSFRSKATAVVNGLFSVGQLISSILAYFCLNNLTVGNWRLLLLICSFPPLLVWFATWKWFKESPRFVILKGDLNKGIDILNHIGNVNKGNTFVEFGKKDIPSFEIWREGMISTIKTNNFESFKHLFGQKYRMISVTMWTIWFCIAFVFYGINFILPLFLNERDKYIQLHNKYQSGTMILIITSFGESISGIIAYFIINTETFGKKRPLAVSQAISVVSCLIVYFSNFSSFYVLVIFLTLGRTFSKMCFPIINPYIAELYPSSLRVIGIGLSGVLGHFASCIMPMIAIKLFYFNFFFPFLLYFIIGFVGLIATIMIPYDTREKRLDIELREEML